MRRHRKATDPPLVRDLRKAGRDAPITCLRFRMLSTVSLYSYGWAHEVLRIATQQASLPSDRKVASGRSNSRAMREGGLTHDRRHWWNTGVKKSRHPREHEPSASAALRAAAAIAMALQLQVGDLATIGAGDAARCGRVTYIDANPTGVSWYWLELEPATVPSSVVRSRLEQLQPGCGSAVGGGSTRSRPQ